jgi:hypothetical protein
MESYSELLNCQVGKLPMKYLGVPVNFSNLKNIDWELLDAKRWLRSWMPRFVIQLPLVLDLPFWILVSQ